MMEVKSLPLDQRMRVIVHEICPEEESFITSSGLVSFISTRDEPGAQQLGSFRLSYVTIETTFNVTHGTNHFISY